MFKYGHFPSFAVFIAAYMCVTVVIVLKKISVYTVYYKTKKIGDCAKTPIQIVEERNYFIVEYMNIWVERKKYFF